MQNVKYPTIKPTLKTVCVPGDQGRRVPAELLCGDGGHAGESAVESSAQVAARPLIQQLCFHRQHHCAGSVQPTYVPGVRLHPSLLLAPPRTRLKVHRTPGVPPEDTFAWYSLTFLL